MNIRRLKPYNDQQTRQAISQDSDAPAEVTSQTSGSNQLPSGLAAENISNSQQSSQNVPAANQPVAMGDSNQFTDQPFASATPLVARQTDIPQPAASNMPKPDKQLRAAPPNQSPLKIIKIL